ncbi:MAG: hypothetical protein PUK40_03195 [Actinomycetaceae bacterium]|nr:hypothetical protein [Arcanobacterium sp.]MDD7504948.1 hypothetical protein [Actinomycetaceae bacterium]MDY6143294.1 hypothetical protein [Arcanobacterium sp.]
MGSNASSRRMQRSRQAARPPMDPATKKRIRRIIIWAVIAAVIVAGVFIVMKLTRNTLSTIEQAVKAPDPAAQFMPVPCSTQMLSVQYSENHTYAGSEVSFPITLTNAKGEQPCTIDANYNNIEVQVVTGDVHVWDSRSCKAGRESLPLLLDKGLSHDQQVVWPGTVTGEDCQGKDAAQPGTYRARLLVLGEQVGEELVFELPQAPPPEPES